MKRIIWHWTAGTHKANDLDRQHYHFIIEGDGTVVRGNYKPEDNEKIVNGRYAAHTRHANTGSIGVAVAAMHGATQRPFNPGAYPITPKQVDALVDLSARLAKQYHIPVMRETMLSHAEIGATLGIPQNGKWDIAWLPGLGNADYPIDVGDQLRSAVVARMAERKRPRAAEEQAGGFFRMLLRFITALFGGNR